MEQLKEDFWRLKGSFAAILFMKEAMILFHSGGRCIEYISIDADRRHP